LRVRLTAGYEADWGGAKIRLQSLSGENFGTKFAYGWANFLDKKIVVSGGLAIEDLWGLGKLSDNVFDPNVDSVNGVRVALNLIDGLSFGFALPVDQVTYYNYTTVGGVSSTSTKGNVTIGNLFGGVVIGGLYKSDFISAAAGVRLHPVIDSKVYGGTSDGSDYATIEGYADIIAGVEVHPIAPLTVILDARFDTRKMNTDDAYVTDSKNGYARIGPLVQYSVGALTAHIKGDIAIQTGVYEFGGTDYKGENIADTIAASGSVTQASIEAMHALWVPVENFGDASFAVEAGAGYDITDAINLYFNIGSDNAGWIAGNGLYVKPGAKIAVGGGSIEIFDKINGLAADSIERTGQDDISRVINQLQIDFNWSF
jgi:hypothetical protein